ncbi:hypothetical protein BH10BDE1_BH10BDE1_27490 [soil metagenome]
MQNETERTSDFNFEQKFDDVKQFAAEIGSKIPKRTVYWGIGAALLGVAAVAAVMYRSRVRAKNRSTERDLSMSPATEADPDFADTSIGRQPRVGVADTGWQNTVRH